MLTLWPEGWRHEQLVPFYKRTEDHYCFYDDPKVTGIDPEECARLHGRGGPMQVNNLMEEAFTRLSAEFKPSCVDPAAPWGGATSDYNGQKTLGCGIFQQFKDRVDKSGEPKSYLRANRTAQVSPSWCSLFCDY